MSERKGMPIFDQMNEEIALKYAPLFKRGMSQEQVAKKMVEDERDEVQRAEIDIDPADRARIERVVEYGAKELRVAAPRIRFFKATGFGFGGIYYRDWPDEIWVAGDRPYHEMGRLALHELAHVEHVAVDTPHELRERDAERLAARGRHWI